MKFLSKLFNKKAKPELPEFQDCLDSLEVLRKNLIKSRDSDAFDNNVNIDLEYLSDNIRIWQQMVVRSPFGDIKIPKKDFTL